MTGKEICLQRKTFQRTDSKSQDGNSESKETSSEDSKSDTEESSSVEPNSEDESKNQGVKTRERLDHVESRLLTVLKSRSESDNTESVYDPDSPPHMHEAIANAFDKILPRLKQYVSKQMLTSKSVDKLTKDER